MKSAMQVAFCFKLPLPTGRIKRTENFNPYLCSASEKNEPRINAKTNLTTVSNQKSSKYVSDISKGQEFLGTVVRVGPAESSWIDIGVSTKRGKSVHGRLRFSNLRGASPEPVGSAVLVHVHKLDTAAARVEVRRGVLTTNKKETDLNDAIMVDALKIGDKLDGKVVALGNYGAVVDVNIVRRGRKDKLTEMTGFLPRTYFNDEWSSDADLSIRSDTKKIIKVGDPLTVWVREVRSENAFLLLDSEPVDVEMINQKWKEKQKKKAQRRKRPRPETLEIGEEKFGVVSKIVSYGVFVDIGVRGNGLLHYSKMGDKYNYTWRDELQLGSEVIVIVDSYEQDRLALRLVSLGDELLLNAEKQAESATARADDINRVKLLREKEIFMQIRQSNPSVKPTRKSTRKNDIDMSKNLSTDSKPSEIIDDEEGEDDGEADVFSDEYFEDKYGY